MYLCRINMIEKLICWLCVQYNIIFPIVIYAPRVTVVA